ncbi:DUF4129 domain-containing protein [Amycolatopsis sp. CA-230715]|uniref:DUF4129 domain-containing protein n=1 Tax=Amycolatopsis sp. CA-230715 TaxID=2745196 RepID=UPI001C027EB7|nr:DUF4129 domain-containing protein [Amycolatopsis sp. CA-230715]QWF79139.1 hypothetical protein HUW46_02546 [Amycolatopsis sp. CA-230715]
MSWPRSADVPVVIGRDDARAAAEAELAKADYLAAQPSWLERAAQWVIDRLDALFRALTSFVPGGGFGLAVLVALLVVVIVVVRLRIGKTARSGALARPVFADRTRTAAEYRAAAESAAASGAFAAAVRDRFRALVRGMEERGVLDPRPGRTADEAATESGRALPGVADELRWAAQVFDAVHYGGEPATAAEYDRMSALDDRAAAQRPEFAR